MLKTESPSASHTRLDEYPVSELVGALVDDQFHALDAVRACAPQIGAAISAALPRLEAGGRLVYVGAGTSGRLGVLDSVELYPTFSWPHERAIALLAGGRDAMFEAVEGAEDDREQGALDVQAISGGPNDVVMLLAASGATPYVLGALEQALACGALTIGIANNRGSELAQLADIGITLDTAEEVISGSTRLKAGTAQKICLNTISSALMVRLHKVYGNLMVDLQASNAKLILRAVQLTMHATGADEALARSTLDACQFQVKLAILVLLKHVTLAEAQLMLTRANGSVRLALAQDLL